MGPFSDLPADDLRAFLRAIHQDPEDDAPRLVFADWLDDHGDPRAEMLRAGVEGDAKRSAAWAREWLPRWLGPGPAGVEALCEGGLVEWCWERGSRCSWQDVPPAWRACISEGWVGRVRLDRQLSEKVARSFAAWQPGGGPLAVKCWWGTRADGLPRLADFADLRGLDLSGVDFRADHLALLRRLWWVRLSSSGNDDRVAETLAGLSELRSVSLMTHRSPPGSRLTGLPQLRSLSLRSTPTVTTTDLAPLAGGLRDLDLTLCRLVDDAALVHVARQTTLRRLSLSNCDRVTDAGLAALAGLCELRSLDLSHCHDLTDAALRHLSGLTALRSVCLRRCLKLTDAGLPHLAGLHDLRELNLSHCGRLTGVGLDALAGLPRLHALSLEHCDRLTDAGVARLAAFPALRSLDLGRCPCVSGAAVAALKTARPGLKVSVWP